MKKNIPWLKLTGIVAGIVTATSGLYALENSGKNTTDENTIVVGTNTYTGFLPFVYLNNGLAPNEDCILFKEYGLKMEIVIQNDFAEGREAFKKGDIDIIYCTADALGIETSEDPQMKDAKLFSICNWSRGADVLIVNKYISTVKDLVGKIVACSEGTASNTLLINILESNNIDYTQINISDRTASDKVNMKIVENGKEAALAFKNKECDAAVVFSPDDQDIIKMVPDAKVLVSTKQASNIICDGLLAKKDWLQKNNENAKKFVSALLYANSQMNTNENTVAEAAKLFAKLYKTDEKSAINGSHNIYYVTLEDEANFFGITNFTGLKGAELYTKISNIYKNLHLCKSPATWKNVSDPTIIEELWNEPELVKGDQSAEKTMEFDIPTLADKDSKVISTKSISIEYDINSVELNDEAKKAIDKEFVEIAQKFCGARIRIEGNTDNTGNANYNKELSIKRANAIKDYLVDSYHFNPNRFIVVGNGAEKAQNAGSIGPDSQYRTTNFSLIGD